MDFFKFKKPLVEGIILERKSQFIYICEVDGEETRCHCPTTGRVGDFDNTGRPCLLSITDDENRKTKYTVEAISLNKVEDKNKKWIGINQNASNRYIEYFLKKNMMKDMIDTKNKEVLREQKLGISRIDFLVGDTYLEVKTPLHFIDLPIPEHVNLKQHSQLTSTDRMVKHIKDLAGSLKTHQRAIELNVFIYDAPHFRIKPEHRSKDFDKVGLTVQWALKKGLELWQVNLEITKDGVYLQKYFPFNKDWMKNYVF